MEEDDWDLQAVVRGCFGQTTTAAAARDAFSSFPPYLLSVEERVKEEKEEEDLIFPDLFSTPTVLEELEELCKPFFSKSPQKQHQRPQELSISSQRNPSSTSFLPAVSGVQPRQPHQRPIPQTPRSKRRKNPQKRVVCQVPADGISSDMWAWRKYGQKPIKGSPYPRGYYRCSTLKGCLARKQVERSRTDPGMFVITYTAEHNHPRPTHRNSLAGSTRHKFPSSSSSSQQVNEQGDSGALVENGGEHPHKDGSSPSPSPTAATVLSPTTSLTSSMEDEFLQPPQSSCKKEEEEEEEEEEDDHSLLVEDMEIMGDDDMLFLGLEELREPAAATILDGFADQFSAAFPSHWAATSTTTAAGGC